MQLTKVQEEQNKSSRPEGITKFIALMRNLSQYIFFLFMLISEDSGHQQTIYECLNSQQLTSLFESIHEEDSELRMTAIRFVCLLLHGNAKMVELMGLMEGCQASSGHRKYIIGGLDYYKLSLVQMKQLITALSKLKFTPGVLAWSVDLKSFRISYCSPHQQFVFDPNRSLVGIFVRRQIQEDKTDRNRYKIGKK